MYLCCVCFMVTYDKHLAKVYSQVRSNWAISFSKSAYVHEYVKYIFQLPAQTFQAREC